ncbi:MAG TPA: glycoside hydrolase family 19 protein [Paludibacter sp.]|nr:glycoside hydrolase family 19 protein [Paludibacter sp.]
MDYKKLSVLWKLNAFELAHFLGQCSHESNNFRVKEENLNYSAKGLRNTFGKYFKTNAEAEKYARKPQAIANKVYANRMGNDDEKSGDGWKYRGRGYIQLTGKNNYAAFSKFIGEDCVKNPDLVITKYPFESALWFFRTNNIFSLCKDISHISIIAVTKKVNGGTNGLADRVYQTNKYYKEIKQQI